MSEKKREHVWISRNLSRRDTLEEKEALLKRMKDYKKELKEMSYEEYEVLDAENWRWSRSSRVPDNDKLEVWYTLNSKGDVEELEVSARKQNVVWINENIGIESKVVKNIRVKFKGTPWNIQEFDMLFTK